MKKYWSLTESALLHLLAWFDGETDSGGEIYLEMRRRLVSYFDRKNCFAPDDLADETLNRVARRLEEEGSIRGATPEQFLLRAQAVNEKTIGPEHIANVVSLFNLGRVARERRDYAKAEENYRKAIAIVERAFGPDNPRLALILNNVANIYRARGEYAKSLEAHLQVLRISEATRGPYHPLTLLSLGNIAKTYAAQGNIAEAIRFQARVDTAIERNIEMNLAIGSERQKLSYLNSVAERTAGGSGGAGFLL